MSSGSMVKESDSKRKLQLGLSIQVAKRSIGSDYEVRCIHVGLARDNLFATKVQNSSRRSIF